MNLIEFKNVSFSYAIDDDDENQVTVTISISSENSMLPGRITPFSIPF